MFEQLKKSEYDARVAWLRRYQNALRKQRQLEQRLAEAQSAAVSISTALSSVRCQNRDGVSATQRAVERIDEARLRLLAQELACKALYIETVRAILALPDAKEREMLRRRYLRGRSMERIAMELGINERWARRLHRRAILEIQLTGPP